MKLSTALGKQRQSICNNCEYKTKITNRCRKCGCFLFFKTKMLYAECPLGKWKSPLTSWQGN